MNFNVAAMYNLVQSQFPQEVLENILGNPNILNALNAPNANLQSLFQSLSHPQSYTEITQEQTETKNRLLNTFRDSSRFLNQPDICVSEEELKSATLYVINSIQDFMRNHSQDDVISNILRFMSQNPSDQTNVPKTTLDKLERIYIDKDTSIECCICLSTRNLIMFIKLKCGHIFDEECILTWFSQRNTCPMCRSTDLV